MEEILILEKRFFDQKNSGLIRRKLRVRNGFADLAVDQWITYWEAIQQTEENKSDRLGSAWDRRLLQRTESCCKREFLKFFNCSNDFGSPGIKKILAFGLFRGLLRIFFKNNLKPFNCSESSSGHLKSFWQCNNHSSERENIFMIPSNFRRKNTARKRVFTSPRFIFFYDTLAPRVLSNPPKCAIGRNYDERSYY